MCVCLNSDPALESILCGFISITDTKEPERIRIVYKNTSICVEWAIYINDTKHVTTCTYNYPVISEFSYVNNSNKNFNINLISNTHSKYQKTFYKTLIS